MFMCVYTLSLSLYPSIYICMYVCIYYDTCLSRSFLVVESSSFNCPSCAIRWTSYFEHDSMNRMISVTAVAGNSRSRLLSRRRLLTPPTELDRAQTRSLPCRGLRRLGAPPTQTRRLRRLGAPPDT